MPKNSGKPVLVPKRDFVPACVALTFSFSATIEIDSKICREVPLMTRMPVLFIGHGSPLNAIEDNDYTRTWQYVAAELPRPKSILCISAHWFTEGSRVFNSLHPRTVYDLYGFPPELYRIEYKANGAPELAAQVRHLIEADVRIDNRWGIDHGTWSVLHVMYPAADIPLIQLSVDRNAPASAHYAMGRQLATLRDQGVLILGSGNIVHNLSRVDFDRPDGYPWASAFDNYIADRISSRDDAAVIDYTSAGSIADEAFYSPEHFYPLLYALGATEKTDKHYIFNRSCTLGSISMTSYRLG
jgi:4,5-DOPA dioxygenase extradiol